jgi:hypothetical protein
MKTTLRQTVILAALFGMLVSGCSQKSLQVSDVWARPAAAGDNGAVYFVIDNPLKDADTLLSVVCETADQAEIHKSSEENGMMMMEPQKSVSVAAQSKVDFAPGGLHVMLVQLKNDLKVGDHFYLTLYFDRAGAVTISAEVKEQ